VGMGEAGESYLETVDLNNNEEQLLTPVIERSILDSRTMVFASGENNTLITGVINFLCHFSYLFESCFQFISLLY